MPLRSFVHGAFAALLAVSLGCSIAMTTGHADVPIAKSAEDIQPLQAGDEAPRFVVETVDGEAFDFNPQTIEKPALLLSFRGGWCPYCNVYLSEMRHVIPEIQAMGIDVLFLSGDRSEILYEGLSQEAQDDIAGLDYTILSDANAQAAMALGIAFKAGMGTKTYLRTKGLLEGTSMARHNVLPVPSVFAVGTDGLIHFAYTNPDYSVRLPADDLLAVAEEIAAQ